LGRFSFVFSEFGAAANVGVITVVVMDTSHNLTRTLANQHFLKALADAVGQLGRILKNLESFA